MAVVRDTDRVKSRTTRSKRTLVILIRVRRILSLENIRQAIAVDYRAQAPIPDEQGQRVKEQAERTDEKGRRAEKQA